MSDIAAFLLARYDEGYEAARPRTVGQAGIDWMVCAGPSGKGDCHLRGLFNGQREDRWEKQNPSLDEVRAHEMTHASPKQIKAMRDIEAKRRIVALHAIAVAKVDTAPFDAMTGEPIPTEYEVTCSICGWASDHLTSGCETLRLLAEPYSDHAEYDERWRP